MSLAQIKTKSDFAALPDKTGPHGLGRLPLWQRFMDYCEGQNANRLFWLGTVLVSNGCVFIPTVMAATLLTGPHFILMFAALAVMGVAFIANLTGLPTKIAIPAFVLSILANVLTVMGCVALFLLDV